jgi:hypothetical protein
MEDLFLSLKGQFENLYLAGVDNIKPIPFVLFLEDELALLIEALKGNGLDFFKQGG